MSLIDFDEDYSCSIRSLAIEKNSKIKLTKGFLIDIFMFPTPKILKIYHKYDVDYCYRYR